jgi:hypothetical protein
MSPGLPNGHVGMILPMIEPTELEREPAVSALEHLSQVADAGATELRTIGDDLTTMQTQRKRGWSWRRILATSSLPQPLSRLSRLTAELGAASGAFRRALVRALRSEGMQITTIAGLFEVSRQRVSALVRPGASPLDGES